MAFCAGVALSLTTTLGLGLDLQPDVSLYTNGVGLFPSPLGTLAGAFGYPGLAIVQALAMGFLAAGLVLARLPLLAAAALTPTLAWSMFLGVDLAAAVAVAAGVLLSRRSLLGLAVGYHLAVLPVVGIVLGRRWLLAGAAVAAGVLLLTPYGVGASVTWRLPQAVGIALASCVISTLPGVLAGVSVKRLALPALGVLGAATFAAHHDLNQPTADLGNIFGSSLRYAMPVALVGLVLAYKDRREADACVEDSRGGDDSRS
ncbi:MAG: hypothetical protein ABW012_07590 [Gaiellaceae bacterium]